MIMKSNTVKRGKPSVEKRWLRYYPPGLVENLQIPEMTLMEYLKSCNPNGSEVALEFYGREYTYDELFEMGNQVARSLRAIGFKEGDQIPAFLKATPQFLALLLAAEKIGASVLCRDNTIEENVEAVKLSDAKVIFAQDFLDQSELNAFRQGSSTRLAVLVSPYEGAIFTEIPDYVQANINTLYTDTPAHGPRTLDWKQFLAMGELFTGTVEAPRDIDRPLLRCYTSGSTGPSKQVIHSAHTIIGSIHQLNFYGETGDFRPTWLMTNLPPSLVAVVVAMILMPLASHKMLHLDPFVSTEDVDLEVMRYKPNGWGAIPMFFEILMENGRVPDDYDLSHLYAIGLGCEAYNNKQFKNGQKFLRKHKNNAPITVGYGSSEGGSSLTVPLAYDTPIGNGSIGVPMPLADMGIFKPGTAEELDYYQIGEICVSHPGNMVGYDNRRATEIVMKDHGDGKIWLHTGDIGYVNENGVFYALTRGSAPRFGYPDKELATLPMENRLADADIKGIKDEFFVIVPDPEHRHHFLPFLYVIMDEGYELTDELRAQIMDVLEDYEKPTEIFVLPERPFWHYKTNRIGLTEELRKYNFE